MDLNIIPFSTLQGALDAADAADQETDRFNTHFHTHTEIAAVVQESADGSHKHVYPDLTACHFSNWIDLIASSQGFEEWHEIILPLSLVQELLDANAIWTLTGKAISEDAMEDFARSISEANFESDKNKSGLLRAERVVPKTRLLQHERRQRRGWNQIHFYCPHNRGCASADMRLEASNPGTRRYRPEKGTRAGETTLHPA